ncbi:hypothetical protein L227DRAFT_587265 [Lentinus tigrinus ALCF2SS1-6]|uniref:Small ribosomal subunit protein uS10 domain-containing protein n=1 Tax=Lentinus tigrinus ALCF2SS1-6 TaxID=1328759 RepID=A0A5C2S5K9_9APHY|nr:hypothetical protein L227DRAFT_587265 [Lentinus tigrinus ALCF2SS1-6]
MFARSCRYANGTTAVPAASASASSSATPTTSHQQLTEPAYAASIVHGRSVRQPHYLPKTHGIPAAILHFRSYHPHTLDFFVHFASHTASALGRRLWTVLRGPFVHKKSQENFERKTHKRVLKAWDAHPDVVNMLVQYLEKHIAPWAVPVGVGQKKMESVVGYMRLDEQVRAEKLKALSEQIVQQDLARAAAGSEGAL